MGFLNEEDLIGKVIIMATQNLTGSEFLTYMLIFLLLVLVSQMFRMPLELTIAYNLPLALVLATGFASFTPVISVIAFYTALFIAKKNWMS